MDNWLLREPGSLNNPKAWAGRVLQIKAWLGLGWGLLLVVVAPLVRADIFSPVLVAVCALDMWCDGAFNTHMTALNIQKRIGAVSNLIFFARLARLLGALGLAAAGLGSPLTFALARSLATLGGLIAAALVLKPDWKGKATPGNRQVLANTVDYALSELLVVVYMQADVTILNLMTNSQTTGFYSSASGLVNALFIIPATVFNLIIPNLARRLMAEPARFNQAAGKALLGFLGLGLVLAVGIGLFGGWLLRLLLGSQYNVSSVILTMLSPLLLFKSLSYGFAAIILAVGWQKQRLIPQAVSALSNVLANIWIIPLFGVVGVTMVYIGSEFLLTIGYAGLVYWWIKQHSTEQSKKITEEK